MAVALSHHSCHALPTLQALHALVLNDHLAGQLVLQCLSAHMLRYNKQVMSRSFTPPLALRGVWLCHSFLSTLLLRSSSCPSRLALLATIASQLPIHALFTLYSHSSSRPLRCVDRPDAFSSPLQCPPPPPLPPPPSVWCML